MKIKREKNSNTYSASIIDNNGQISKSTPDNTSSDTCLIASPKRSTLKQYKTKGKVSKTSTIVGNCIDNKYLLQDWGLTFNLKQSGRNISISSWIDPKENSAYKKTKYKLSLYRKRSYKINICGEIPGIEIYIPNKELPGRSKTKHKLTLKR